MMTHKFTCTACGENKTHTDPHTTGYGQDKDGNKVCFACCGLQDMQSMRDTGKGDGYLVRNDDGTHKFTNWPGTLSLSVYGIRKSFHNFAGRDGRTDFYFMFEGKEWHGVNIGDQQFSRVHVLKKQSSQLLKKRGFFA